MAPARHVVKVCVEWRQAHFDIAQVACQTIVRVATIASNSCRARRLPALKPIRRREGSRDRTYVVHTPRARCNFAHRVSCNSFAEGCNGARFSDISQH